MLPRFTIMDLSNRIRLVLFRPTRVKKDRPVSTTAETPRDLTDRWLSVDEIASYLGVKRDTVYKWINRQNMPAHKVGRLWKFRRDEIDEWVLSKSDRSGGPQGHASSHLRHGKTKVHGGK
jgi:excisionase family DNA binding protein